MSKQAIFFKTISQYILNYLGSFSFFGSFQEKFFPSSSGLQFFLIFLYSFGSLTLTTLIAEILSFVGMGLMILEGLMTTLTYFLTLRIVSQSFPGINYQKYKLCRTIFRLTHPLLKILNPKSSRVSAFLIVPSMQALSIILTKTIFYIFLFRERFPNLQDIQDLQEVYSIYGNSY